MHYSTQSLKQSAAVEVYRHDPGGWCAIRPLAGSFSLVPESTLKIVDKGVGEIAVDGTQAWVGTKLGPVDKPLWQVKLKKGELVEVVGQVSWPNPEGHSTLWYQISPPAGEFRWIQMTDLQLPIAARLAMEKPKPSADLRTAPSSKQTTFTQDIQTPVGSPIRPPMRATAIQTFTDAPDDDAKIQLAALQTDINSSSRDSFNGGWRQATRPIGNRAVANNSNSSSYQREKYESPRRDMYSTAPGERSSYGRSPDVNYQPETQPARVPANRYADARSSRSSLASSLNAARRRSDAVNAALPVTPLESFPSATILTTHRIDDLEQQLTRELLRDPDEWKTDDLALRAATISRTTTDPNERILADKFLKKIENCRTIKHGFESHTAESQYPRGRARLPIANSTSGSGTVNPQANVALGTTYDAHGWLNQMVTDGGQGNPSYVLQDQHGKITHHISPVQGMNLHRFLKSHIGIIGQRGYHRRLQLDHVTAHRIVELPIRR